ncbi:MAG TPA: hydrogen gas-evolving membrane-bound hydrogenase subunit E, partial [Bryobacteraceae bacterium]|nr:hydrogen gas-evolving membrane-bound hydrogenase subunit E [Bryobacteraceae bacterium]
FLGFLGKELLYESLLAWSTTLLIGAIAASALLGTAGLIAGVSPFAGALRGRAPEHRVPAGLTVPALILAFLGLIAGIVPGLVELPAGLASGAILRRPVDASLSMWHGFTPVLGLSLATLALVALLYAYRDLLRRRIWPRSLGSERLYTSTVRGLDALSAWASPMLQSASLRSYLLVLVTTAGILIFATLVFEGLPGWPAVMDVQPHEACAAILIVAGAISAVWAKSSITAVLSLGVSGYGVALTYLFFGAPDLAMTQFSVETLTAVIFVLVFYHFRDFGSLSPWTDRLRGAAVSVLFGGSIAVVLLFVGANITPFRLANYFAEMGLPLAHGRNIVNVILVDFRALDTMGEITVLATAAFGVRALMRISRKERKNG